MRIIMLLALLLTATPSYAAAVFKQSDICTPSNIPPGGSADIDRRKLVGQILKTVNVADIDLDPTGGEVTFAMKREAIVDPPQFCKVRGCSGDTQVQLGTAYIAMRRFILANNKKPPAATGGFEIVRTGSGVTGDITPRELMDATFAGISATCWAPAKPSGQPGGAGGNGNGGGAAGGPPGKTTEPQVRFMVRKSVQDLSTLQSSDAFKGLDRATFAVTTDYLKNLSTYNVNGVVGIGLSSLHPAANVDADLIAYGLYNRQFFTGSVPKSSTQIYNIGGGFADNFLFDSPAGAANLQWATQYLESEISNGRLWSTSLTYTPLTGPFIGRAEYFGPFAVVLIPYASFTHGEVLDHGTDPTFVANKGFDRIGGHLESVIYFDSIDPSTSWLQGFTWRNIYDYYYGITGFYRSIDRFESKLSFTFPDQQFWSVDLDYISGRTLDTLQLQQQLTLGVGLKY